MKKTIVIYGAGKIGRGFVADSFSAGGYELIFADSSEKLVNDLNSQGKYTLYNIRSADEQEKKTISGFKAYTVDDPRLPDLIISAGLMAVVVFPKAFDDVSAKIADIIKLKSSRNDPSPLDIIVVANIPAAKESLKEHIYGHFDSVESAFADKVLGLAGTAVMRVAVPAKPEMLAEDALTVLTDGHPVLPIENSFLGKRPECPMLEYHDNFEVLELFKLYSYNMAHASAAYLGRAKGYDTICDALSDPEIEQIVSGALEEITQAFVAEHGFDPAEMASLKSGIIKKFKNPLLNDTPERVGVNPIRKLARGDRIIGAALKARKNAIYPYYLLKVAAYGLMFSSPEDEAAVEIQRHIRINGITSAIKKFTGLNEADMIYTIRQHYIKADGKFVPEDKKRVDYLKKAYNCGFFAEKQYKGCAQCTLIGMARLTGIENKELFQACTGYSGGMALCGDGVCGGYSGGILFMGMLRGRNYDRMVENGDKESQYFAYECSQELHDRFKDCYGSPVCRCVHESMFDGRHFTLRTKPVREKFEEAGAHTVVCTTVVAMSCVWVTEILLDRGMLSC